MALRGVSRERSPGPAWQVGGAAPRPWPSPPWPCCHARVPRPSLALVPRPWCDQDPQRAAVSTGTPRLCWLAIPCLSASRLVRKDAEHQLRGFGGNEVPPRPRPCPTPTHCCWPATR